KAASATSIGQLAAHWAGELIGDTEPAYPFLALPEEHCNFGQRVASALLNPVTISFGVGGNERKRVSAEFEEDLIAGLSAQSKLILDKGASPEEREQINRLVARLRAQGKTVVELNETNKADLIGAHLQQADVVTWDGGIGAFAGLIAGSNRYIGYDSAGQHIAAALGVPTLTVFVNSGNATFARRWRPFGRGDIEVVTVEAKQNQAPQQSVNCCGALPADDPFVLRTVETLLNQKAHRA
ncbi:MAG TPA: glycosyltransferase family 9 protein, partial [Blastocatellia bacterium]|nr:glycosyltransferase family 9 protein [Blastocatellia bacterium]